MCAEWISWTIWWPFEFAGEALTTGTRRKPKLWRRVFVNIVYTTFDVHECYGKFGKQTLDFLLTSIVWKCKYYW